MFVVIAPVHTGMDRSSPAPLWWADVCPNTQQNYMFNFTPLWWEKAVRRWI